MNDRKLILLTPYPLPGQYPLTLGAEDMACWLNAYAALWHPALLWGAAGPPITSAPYDYEQPQAGQFFVVPESPPLIMPDDWDQRVQAAGAAFFRATPDPAATLANLKVGLEKLPPDEHGAVAKLLALPPEDVRPFRGIGLGYLLGATLCEAMEHENLLEVSAFWDDIQKAIAALAGLPYGAPAPPQETPSDTTATDDGAQTGDASSEPPPFDSPPYNEPASSGDAYSAYNEEMPYDDGTTPAPAVEKMEGWRGELQTAAQRLLSAREVLYPVPIHLVDLFLLDEKHLAADWPAALALGSPLNVVASGALLEKLAAEQPERLAQLRERIQAETAEVCGGGYLEREDILLPLESQLWNLLKGQAVARDVLGSDVRVFARRRFGLYPHMPQLLQTAGLTRAVFLAFDDSALPPYNTPVISWPSPDGKQIEAFARKTLPADNPETFFNLANALFKTIREDHTASIALLHTGKAASPWYEDWMELSRFGPIFGQWTTLSRFLNAVPPGEYASALAADEFHFDYLSERVHQKNPTEGMPAQAPPVVGGSPDPSTAAAVPVSGFASHVRMRRRMDTCWTLAAIHRGLAGRTDPQRIEKTLSDLEDQVERSGTTPTDGAALNARMAEMEAQVANTLAARLLSRATSEEPGYLLLNQCSYIRRVALELDGAQHPLPITGPVKACQIDGDKLRLVVDVPALGFAWFPRSGPKGTPAQASKIKLADDRHVRNEFFEAEIDTASGGLRGIQDHRTGLNRLAQRLVFHPAGGGTMRASQIKVTSAGPALGEVVSEGAIYGEKDQVLAKFRQRYRAWLGRPLLELRIELWPEQGAAGYPWHAYYGSRFAWRDDRAAFLRSVNGTAYLTTHVRPQTPDFIEMRVARQSTAIFTGGLPFHQRHESRMMDVILTPEGETGHVFDLAIGLDREHPSLTALGFTSPVVAVPVAKGPPHIGATGWLFHLDAPSLLLTTLRPGSLERTSGDPDDALVARMLECAAFSGTAEFRCVRNPQRVALVDARGNLILEPGSYGDAAQFDVAPGDLIHLQVQFS
jgi:hypothetical protein